MTYLIQLRGHYYFNRRVPEYVAQYDSRALVRVSLRTTERKEAWKKAVLLNEQVEAYWQDLIKAGVRHENKRFQQTVSLARQMGFNYQPVAQVAALPLQELLERIITLKDATPKQVEAVLGGAPEPQLKLSEMLEIFWGLSKDRVLDKSEHQIRKWRNPRKKAVSNFLAVVGDKAIKDINRSDIIAFRDWWLVRIENDNKHPDSANKNFIHLKDILDNVCSHLEMDLKVDHLFKKIFLKTKFKQTRLPFTSEQILNILNSPRLENTHPEAKWLLHAMAETGARPAELVGLLPEDIILEGDVPHIKIVQRKKRKLKTDHSEREIPLVGFALKAFQHLPQGFSRYKDNSDVLTTTVNKFLRENELMPSEKHTVYSLRHSFQDRILAVNTPDRIQAELMGHKFNRPKYGAGGSLEQKMEWLQRVKLAK
ncbi:MAG: tyrosine-type recombinase/integrase [Bacteroidetes bacterium]|nr:tyrosine-type recombinase/integrase [Bacteroidota bacterium]